MKKYAVVSGFVISQTDGQRHFISCGKLIDLYGVNPKECVLIAWNEKNRYSHLMKQLIVLTPKENGNYKVPEK